MYAVARKAGLSAFFMLLACGLDQVAASTDTSSDTSTEGADPDPIGLHHLRVGDEFACALRGSEGILECWYGLDTAASFVALEGQFTALDVVGEAVCATDAATGKVRCEGLAAPEVEIPIVPDAMLRMVVVDTQLLALAGTSSAGEVAGWRSFGVGQRPEPADWTEAEGAHADIGPCADMLRIEAGHVVYESLSVVELCPYWVGTWADGVEAVAVEYGFFQACVLGPDDLLTCRENTGTIPDLPDDRFVQIAPADHPADGGCGLTDSATVRCWGLAAQLDVPSGEFAEVAVNNTYWPSHDPPVYACAIDLVGEAVCWGDGV